MKTISTLKLNIAKRSRWIVALCAVALLAGGVLAFNSILPKSPHGFRGGQSRLGWYVHSGQLQADARTVAAAADFVFSPDNAIPPAHVPVATQQVAGTSSQLPRPQG